MQGDAQQPAAMTELIARIDRAIQRVVDGNATMRIPADLTDPDLVLADCKRALLAAQAQPPEPWWKDPRNFESAEAMLELERAAAPPVPAQAAPSMEAPNHWHSADRMKAWDEAGKRIRDEEIGLAHPTTAAPAGVPSGMVLESEFAQRVMVALQCGTIWVRGSEGQELIRRVSSEFAARIDGARASSPSGASQEALTADAKDAARFAWYFSDKPKGDWLATYLDGVRTGWTTDQWRAAIDAAMEQQHAQEQEGAKE